MVATQSLYNQQLATHKSLKVDGQTSFSSTRTIGLILRWSDDSRRGDIEVDEKELKNVDQYEDLARELGRLWKV